MLAVPLVYSGLSFAFGPALSLWGAVAVAGLLGIVWFHRARRRPVFLPYIVIWIILGGALWYASTHNWCSADNKTLPFKVPGIFCPFPR